MIFTLKICGIYNFYDILILPLIPPQVLAEVAHAEARDNGAHEGEAVQVRAVQLPDGHALHPQQARLRHPQGRQGLPVPG